MRFSHAARRRLAVSEIIGSLLTIAITIIAGTAVWGYVRTQAGVSELSYANNVGTTNNFLNEQFKAIDMYFATTTQLGFWVYNTGNTNFQTFSVRVYDSAGRINVLYNYTGSTSKTDRIYDLKASSTYYYSTCRMTGSTYESPTISTVNTVIQNAQLILLTIPPNTTNCPSYVNFSADGGFVTGRTYSIVVTGLYGNVVTYYQVK